MFLFFILRSDFNIISICFQQLLYMHILRLFPISRNYATGYRRHVCIYSYIKTFRVKSIR